MALSRVLNGHAAVGPELALRPEAANSGRARMWPAVQIAFDPAGERAAGERAPGERAARKRAAGTPTVRPLRDVA